MIRVYIVRIEEDEVHTRQTFKKIQDSLAYFGVLTDKFLEPVSIQKFTSGLIELVKKDTDYVYVTERDSKSQLRDWFNKQAKDVAGDTFFTYSLTRKDGSTEDVDYSIVEQEYKRKNLKSVKMVCTNDKSVYATYENGVVSTNLKTNYIPFFRWLDRKAYNRYR